MSLPIVAICGRPNVGKSTLFNVLAGRRIAIEDPTSGVTRDRIETRVELEDHYFRLIDTGGIGIVDEQNLGDQIYEQVRVALEQADLILFVVDIKEGITPLDKQVAKLLRESHKEVWLVANKTDVEKLTLEADTFQPLGFGSPLCISAKHRYELGELKEKLLEFLKQNFPDSKQEENLEEEDLKLAVVGKPNSGKSTFINTLAQEERVIVSEIPGTTRDSVDVLFQKDGKSVLAIDTAGVKRRKQLGESIAFFSQKRAEKSIRRCDVALLLLDATKDIVRIDKEIAEYIRQEHKPVIIVVNKWDLVPAIPTESYVNYISHMLPGLLYAPIIFITAKTGKNVPATIDLSRSIFKQANKRVTTGELNRVLEEILKKRAPSRVKGQQAKIYYATQVGVNPPHIVLFINSRKLITKGYQRYLFNALQEELGFAEVPLKLDYREKEQKDLPG